MGQDVVRASRWRLGAVIAAVAFLSAAPLAMASLAAAAVNLQAQPAQEEFVPIDELPPEDRLPAAPFLVAAYSIIWILAFGYMWLVAGRLAKTEQEIADLSRRAGRDTEQSP